MQKHYVQLDNLMTANNCTSAIDHINSNTAQYGKNTKLLYLLDAARINMECGKYETANQHFHDAEELAQEAKAITAGMQKMAAQFKKDKRIQEILLDAANEALSTAVKTDIEAIRAKFRAEQAKRSAALNRERMKRKKLPMVVPLIVSENLELESVSRSSQVYREYGLALIAAFENVGLEGGFGKVINQLRKQTGNDYNALLTTARLTDNSIRVRLGAMRSPNREGGVGYEMVPRNHIVSFLLFVPDECNGNKMSIVANTQMRDQEGNLLKDRSFKERNKLITQELKGSILPGVSKISSSAIYYFYGAANAVQANDWKGFIIAADKMMDEIKKDNNFKPGLHTNYSRLWTEVAALVEGGQMSHTSFELTQSPYQLPNPKQGKPILSIGKKHLSASFVGGSNLFGHTLNITLSIDGAEGPIISAQKIEVNRNGTGFVTTFTSPDVLGLPLGYIGTKPKACITVGEDNATFPLCFDLFPNYLKEKSGKPAPFSLAVSALPKLPLAKDTTAATLVVSFNNMKLNLATHDLVVRIKNAEEKSSDAITSEGKGTSATLSQVKDGWRKLSGNGRFNIELMNLYNGLRFKIEYGLRTIKKPTKNAPWKVEHLKQGPEVIVLQN